MKHLAIDLETLSLKPNAHILSIGAVFFCPREKRLGPKFHIVIDPEAEQVGAHISASTVYWWFNQIVHSGETAFSQGSHQLMDLASAAARDRYTRPIAIQERTDYWQGPATDDRGAKGWRVVVRRRQ